MNKHSACNCSLTSPHDIVCDCMLSKELQDISRLLYGKDDPARSHSKTHKTALYLINTNISRILSYSGFSSHTPLYMRVFCMSGLLNNSYSLLIRLLTLTQFIQFSAGFQLYCQHFYTVMSQLYVYSHIVSVIMKSYSFYYSVIQ